MDKFKILQNNVQSLRKNKNELAHELHERKIDVALLSEIWTDENNVEFLNVSNYHKILKPREKLGGGVGIFLRDVYNYIPLDLTSSEMFEVVGVRVPLHDLTLVSVYINPRIRAPDLEVGLNTLEVETARYTKILVGGDFNAHNTLWGCDTTSNKGKVIWDFISRTSLMLLNNGSKTFRPATLNCRPSAIDLSMCSTSIFNDTSWTVHDHTLGGSGHLLIEMEIRTIYRKKERPVLNRKQINEDIHHIVPEDFESIKDLGRVIQTSIKRNSGTTSHTPKYYWSQEMTELYKEKVEARKLFNRLSNEENLINMKRANARFLRQKKLLVKDRLSSITKDIDPRNTKANWQLVRRLRYSTTNDTRNNIISTSKETAESFLKENFGATQEEVIEVRKQESKVEEREERQLLTVETWSEIIGKKKARSAPGTDRLTYEMLRNLSVEAKTKVVQEINEYFVNGCLPNYLKEIRIVPIKKPGRDPRDVKSSRPIACLPTIVKSANSAVLHIVQRHMEEHQILPELSFGFRTGKSTEDCLEYATNHIMEGKRRGLVSIGVFFDFTNAFNSVSVEKLTEILQEAAFPEDTIVWIQNFLCNRRLIITTEQGQVSTLVSKGLPQGDVLSPTLFNIYTKSLHETDQEQDGVVTLQFADDFLKIIQAATLEEAKEKAQDAIDRFATASNLLDLELNGSKTKAVLFQPKDVNLQLNVLGMMVETVRYHKYLGLYLDQNLTFGTHIRELKHKVADRQNMLKIIGSIKKGATPKVMVLFHKALYSNFIAYGSALYGRAAKSYQEALEVTNRKCQRIATGCSRTTPVNTLAALANEEPLKLKRYFHTKKKITLHFKKGDAICQQLRRLEDSEDADPTKYTYMELVYLQNSRELDKVYCSYTASTRFDVEVHENIEGIPINKKKMAPGTMRQIALEHINKQYGLWTKVYTDASRTEDACGIGIHETESNTNISMRLETKSSIMTAELLGIKTALNEISKQPRGRYVILTDSQSGCKLINSHQRLMTWDELTGEICSQMQATGTILQWIPGHVGLQGNERADQLAKQGLTSNAILVNKLLWTDIVRIFKQQLAEATNNWYRETALEAGKGRKFFGICGTYPKRPWYWTSNFNGEETRMLNRIISGHDFSDYWLAKMKIKEFEECELCGKPNTTEHVLLECIKYGHLRNHFDWEHYDNLNTLLCGGGTNLCEEELKSVLKFIRLARLQP